MAPLKIAIASLLVGLIGLTASAMENPGSSSASSPASPHATERQPLIPYLTVANVRKKLNQGKMRQYSTRLRDLALSEASYRYKHRGRTRTHALSDPFHLREKIYETERDVLERMENPESSSASPHATEPQPLTTALTMQDVRQNSSPAEMRAYVRRLKDLALIEAGYRYYYPNGMPRKKALPEPDFLKESIIYKENEILQKRRSEQGGAQAEQLYGAQAEQGSAQAEGEEPDWEQLEQLNWEQLMQLVGAQAERGGAQAEQLYGAQAEGEELDVGRAEQLDVAQAEQGGAQAEGEEPDWEQLEQLNWEQLGPLNWEQVWQLDGAQAEQLDDEQAETARQIYADFGEDKPIHSNPTSPHGSSGVTSGYRPLLP